MRSRQLPAGKFENLVIRTDEPDSGSGEPAPAHEPGGQAADGAGRYAVVAGGHRLKAMQTLAGDGVLDADHPVPCLVAADRNTVGELSLAENVVRIAMHPADQVVAFTKLTEASHRRSLALRMPGIEAPNISGHGLGRRMPRLSNANRPNRTG